MSDYETGQIDRITDPANTFYRVVFHADATGAVTKWMNISPAQLAAIREILAAKS